MKRARPYSVVKGWAERMSAGDTSTKIACEYGVTRNVVIGAVNRFKKNNKITNSNVVSLPPRTMADIERIVAELDPQLEKQDEAFQAAAVLLIYLFFNFPVWKVSQFTGYSSKFVCRLSKNWHDQGMLKEDAGKTKIYMTDMDEEDTMNIGFWLHVLLGLGYVSRTVSENLAKATQ